MREEELVLKVQEAIRSLQNAGLPVSTRAIANSIGTTHTLSNRYPEAKRILDEIKRKPKQAHN
jgi:hypothetical protein